MHFTNYFDPLVPLIGQHRPKQIRFDHVLRTAALELELPISWLWYWAWAGWLKPRSWLGRNDCINFADIIKSVHGKRQAFQEAAQATGEYVEVSREVWEELPLIFKRFCIPKRKTVDHSCVNNLLAFWHSLSGAEEGSAASAQSPEASVSESDPLP